ncbi:histidine kinase [Caloramator sp. mosi_1]|uniref:histidine kinase dimerization/phosphoacceptor domain-containing protein n=1 Tax=Caloramator sp. mosi_1 TaxID=3023090 RepID=UPI00235EC6E7|nr:histidine kinase [Caloramator sp. mosi_1]WDC83465.1 histidine kinase [Caloramator sp. mosi_1]
MFVISPFIPKSDFLLYIFIFLNTITLAKFYLKSKMKEEIYITSLDNERKLRYELEFLKRKLFDSLEKTEELSIIRERDRISRELHDSLGHKITGILFQLQACLKLIDKDKERSIELLESSIKELSDTLKLIRETVHKLKPKNVYDIEFIKKLLTISSIAKQILNIVGI